MGVHLRLIVMLLTVINGGIGVVKANKFTVGDSLMWYPNVNYTPWEQKYNNSIHVGDWLVFLYKEGQADVIQVNESGFNKCDSSYPLSNYSRGRSFAYQLNESKRYYFICSMGYCYGGMRISVVAHPLPPPSPPPSSSIQAKSLAVDPVRVSFASIFLASIVCCVVLLSLGNNFIV